MTMPEPMSARREASGARFQRGLLFFSVVFSLLLLADLGLIGNLMFRDLSDRVVTEAQRRALESARSIARSLERRGDGTEELTVVDTRRAVTRHAAGELDRVQVVENVHVYAEDGRLLHRFTRRADLTRRPEDLVPGRDAPPERPFRSPELPGGPETGVLERRGPDGPVELPWAESLRPGSPPPERAQDWSLDPPSYPTDDAREAAVVAHLEQQLQRMGFSVPDLTLSAGEPRDLVRVSGSRRTRNVVVPARLPGGQRGTVEVSLSEDEINRQIDQLRQDLLLKIGVGAAVSVLLIVVAYIFVVKLFHKTRRLQAETQMADRLAYVGTLAAGLAHEIRNPLSAMKLNLQMLESSLAPPRGAADDGETRELLNETQAEVDRLGLLVTSFLSYARPPRLLLKPTDLNRLVEDTARFLQADAESRGVTVRLDPGPDLPVLDLDGTQVRQAVLNVLSNAISALEAKGGGHVDLSTRVEGGEAHLVIADDGPGIPPEKLPHIFQVFYSGRPGGTGLGLPIARRVMESHGGRIDVDSSPGRGTRFTLAFPAPGARTEMKAAL